MKNEIVFTGELTKHEEKIALETEIATLELAIECLENIKQEAEGRLEGIKALWEKSQGKGLIDVVVCNGKLYHRNPITYAFDMEKIVKDAKGAIYMEDEDDLAFPIFGAVWTDTGLTFVSKYEKGEWEPI